MQRPYPLGSKSLLFYGKLFCFFSLMFAPGNSNTQAQFEVAQQYFKRGEQCLKNQEFDCALEEFSKLIKHLERPAYATKDAPSTIRTLEPNLAFAYNARGFAYTKKRETQLALADFDSALTISPKTPTIWYNRGIAKDESGDFKGALSDYDRCIKLNPGFESVWFNRAAVRFLLKDNVGAEQDFQKALKYQPRNVMIMAYLGFALRAQGKVEASFAILERCLDLERQHGLCLAARGATFLVVGKWDEALGDLNQAQKQYPMDPDILNNRALTHRLLKKQVAALQDHDRAIAIAPSGMRYFNRGETKAWFGNYFEALPDFEEAWKLNPALIDAKQAHAIARERMMQQVAQKLRYELLIPEIFGGRGKERTLGEILNFRLIIPTNLIR